MKNDSRAVLTARLGRTLGQSLVDWYELEHRELPWRNTRDPYAIWISEVMLQQTRVEAVKGRWERFLRRFPTLKSLAEAELSELLAEWAGLGYYRRARLLHQAAKRVQEEHKGSLPRQYTALRELPGLGAYTAAAVASIAFDEAVPAVDGNVERVLSRVFALEGNPKSGATARAIREAAQILMQTQAPQLFTQALMELGALVCLPKRPSCESCPWARECRAYREGRVASLPERAAARRVEEVASYAAILRKNEKLLWRRRPAGGHNEGLWELPTTDWHPGELDEKEARTRLANLGREYHAEWRVRERLATVRHSITFHRITLTAFAVSGEVEGASEELRWASVEEARTLGLTAAAAKLSRKLAN